MFFVSFLILCLTDCLPSLHSSFFLKKTPLLVELPNYSTESTDEETNEHSYYDDSSSSAMEEPDSTMDNQLDLYDQQYPYDPYYSSAPRSADYSLLLLAIVGLVLRYWEINKNSCQK